MNCADHVASLVRRTRRSRCRGAWYRRYSPFHAPRQYALIFIPHPHAHPPALPLALSLTPTSHSPAPFPSPSRTHAHPHTRTATHTHTHAHTLALTHARARALCARSVVFWFVERLARLARTAGEGSARGEGQLPPGRRRRHVVGWHARSVRVEHASFRTRTNGWRAKDIWTRTAQIGLGAPTRAFELWRCRVALDSCEPQADPR
jgi:hypothetical protein